jgi:hypothetical protein
VVPNGLSAKVRKLIVVRNLGPTHNLGVYNNNIRAVERAFKERYFLCKTTEGFVPAITVRPRTYEKDMMLKGFRDVVTAECRGAPIVTVDNVVNSYVGPKRALYAAAAISLSKEGLSKKDARLTSFIKFEKQDLTKAPRVINPRSPRFNLVLGKYLKFLEKRVYKAINKAFGAHTSHTVIKGLNVLDAGEVLRSKWLQFEDPVALGLDATKFDMHVTVEALKYEHSFYTTIFPQSRELRKILRWQLFNSGTAWCDDGKVKFRMQGTRSSGDLNTSLGNCVIMCALVYARARSRGVRVELCNNGDDCVVIMERRDLDRFTRGIVCWFKRYGFRMQVEKPVFEFEQIEFCQSHPVWTDRGWTMVRNISSCFKKDPMCLVPVHSVGVLSYWLAAVGDCGLSITAGVPVMQEWYGLFRRHGINYSQGFLSTVIKNTSARERMCGVKGGSVSITGDARCSFYYAFGVNPDEQIALETVFGQQSISLEIDELFHEEDTCNKTENQCHPLVAAVC